MESEDTEVVADPDDLLAAPEEHDSLTFFERVLPESALGRWAIYLAVAAVVAAVLWFWVFPPLQNLLPAGF